MYSSKAAGRWEACFLLACKQGENKKQFRNTMDKTGLFIIFCQLSIDLRVTLYFIIGTNRSG